MTPMRLLIPLMSWTKNVAVEQAESIGKRKADNGAVTRLLLGTSLDCHDVKDVKDELLFNSSISLLDVINNKLTIEQRVSQQRRSRDF